jgi:cytochrome oxidase assembly protein ShyY1
MNFIRSIIAMPRDRHVVWVTLAMCVGVALTVRLGFWQVSRAEEKQQRHDAIQVQMDKPVLDTAQLLEQPDQFQQLHRRISLLGFWLPEHTVYLDNRPMNGRAGFWVLTPLALDGDHWVLVQRGWVPRHQQDRTLLPAIETPKGVVHLQGRIALPPSDLLLRDDLRSRLGWGHVYELHLLSEAERRAVLRMEADARGIFLSDEVISFVLSRFSRDLSSLMQLLDQLDGYALQTQRAITVPLIKAMLESE